MELTQSNPPSQQGVITTSFGKRHYLELAVDMALSVQACSSLPVSIATDTAGGKFIRQCYPNVFDQVIVEPRLDTEKGALRKIVGKAAALAQSPYEKTIFFDADVICVKDPSYLFEEVRENDVVVFGRRHTRETARELKIRHHNMLIADFMEGVGIDSYYYTFLCAFVYDQTGGQRLGKLFVEKANAWNDRVNKSGWRIPGDEVYLGLLGDESGVRFYPKIEKPFQTQGFDFRWEEDFCFIHSAAMPMRELRQCLKIVIRNRRQQKLSPIDALFWLSELMTRRCDFGHNRRLTKLIVQITSQRGYPPGI